MGLEKTMIYDDDFERYKEIEDAARNFYITYIQYNYLKSQGVEDGDMDIKMLGAEIRLRRALCIDVDALHDQCYMIYSKLGLLRNTENDTWGEESGQDGDSE